MAIHTRSRAALLLLALLSASWLVACEQAARLIPDSTATPPATSGTGAGASATPIIVNADGSTSMAGGPGQVIADHDLALSVVQVLVADDSAGFEQVVRYGTGVIVDAEAGLIATAFPIVDPFAADGSPAYTSLIVATDREPGTEPQREFLAELAAADPALDLAVLRITGRVDGAPLGEMDLPGAFLGAADSTGTGSTLRLFGYPGIAAGAEASPQIVETAQANVEGQRGAVGRTGRTWFKVDARMPFGAAGGPAFDRLGGLVGILAQDRYHESGVVAQVRPLDLLTPLVDQARTAAAPYQPPLYRDDALPGSLLAAPASTAYVSRPVFAENALEAGGGRDLFDYETRFVEGLGALYYEYEVNGVADGSIVEEQWFLNGVQQESLSSSVSWSQGAFGYVIDRITAPSPAGMPNGRWRLDVFVDGVLHATATAIIGVELGTPEAIFQAAAATATAEGGTATAAFNGAPQLLMSFDVAGMSGTTDIEWQVFRDNQPVFTSATVPWTFGEAGRFWVGYAPPEGIGPGTWDVELHAGGSIIGVGTVSLF